MDNVVQDIPLFNTASHIAFLSVKKNQECLRKSSSNYLYLLDESYDFNLLNLLPREFTISTNTNSCCFNITLLKDSSSMILDHIKNNPQSLQYHLDINDEENVLKKFEQMYQGETIFFDEEDLPISKKITKLLNITCCPNYMKPERLKENKSRFEGELDDGVKLSTSHFNNFIKDDFFNTFKIITKNNEYLCNSFGVYSSEVIRKEINENPEINSYKYDFNDDFNEFQFICDLFNFQIIDMTSNNIQSLKEIAEDLQIKVVLEKINEKLNEFEKISKSIDEQQTNADIIEELFTWLYHIPDLKVDFVKDSIVDSFWSKTEDDVHELAAFIIQVVKAEPLLHPYLADLLIQLDCEANDSNSLKILKPFIVKKLMDSFGADFSNCSFIYNLYKRGVIQKDELYKHIKNNIDPANIPRDESVYENLNIWFFPELIEMNIFNFNILPREVDSTHYDEYGSDSDSDISVIINSMTQKIEKWKSFIQFYIQDKIELFKQMRDNGEPIDELTKSLRYDDIDTLQSIVIKRDMDFSNSIVPFNMFENYILNGETSYINYAAAYGSIKCFKYLLLNHATIDEHTFRYAIFGGNVEIIKIVDQHSVSDDISNNKKESYYSQKNDIIPSIIKHRNDLFDWILEHKYINKGEIDAYSNSILTTASKNGNAHSFIEIIDKINDITDCYESLIENAAKHGFYRLTLLIFNLNNKNEEEGCDHYHNHSYEECQNPPFAKFGNLSIFKLSLQILNAQEEIENSLSYAISKDYNNIINFFFDELIKKDFKISPKGVYNALDASLNKDSNDMFLYLMREINKANPNIFHDIYRSEELLIKACSSKNIEAVKILTDMILENVLCDDFMIPFYEAAKSNSIEICQYFVDKKVFINYEKLHSMAYKFGFVDSKIFSMMIDNSEIEIRDRFYRSFLYPAVSAQNINLVEYLLEHDVPLNNSLLLAVKSENLEMVNLILKYNSQPSFINKISDDGTALIIAVNRNNLPIVNRLLSLPGIDANLYNNHDETPLMIAVNNFNLEIVNSFFDFYGDDIKSQKCQIEEALKAALEIVSNNINDTYGSPWDTNKNCNKNSKFVSILKRFLEIKNIDPNCHSKKYTMLSYACETNEIDLVRILLKKERINVNSYTPIDGNTPLMIAIENKNVEIAKLLIEDKRTNINQRNYTGKTSLTFAVKNNLTTIIDLLIKNERFDPIESCLDLAFFMSDDETSKQLFTLNSLDVNYVSLEETNHYSPNYYHYYQERKELYSTALTVATSNNNIKMVDLIVSHHSFQPIKSQLKQAIFISVEKNKFEIFQKLIQLQYYDVNISSSQMSLLTCSVKNRNVEITNAILNDPKFDSIKSKIDETFIECSLNMCETSRFISYYNVQRANNNNNNQALNDLIDCLHVVFLFDQNHSRLIDCNKLLPNGKSFFTYKINSKQIENYVNFFLELGADPNLPDKEGVYPLEHAIDINSKEYVLVLINSGKIDFNVKIRTHSSDDSNSYQSYLHLAAESSESEILKIFLDKKLIDINITDNNGQTPLMNAVKLLRKTNIGLLFENDDLDYLHRNNNGSDALKIAREISGSGNSNVPSSREEYLNSLREEIIQAEHNFYIKVSCNDNYSEDNINYHYGDYDFIDNDLDIYDE